MRVAADSDGGASHYCGRPEARPSGRIGQDSEVDSSDRTSAQKVVADKPAAVVDRCTTAHGLPAPCVVPPSGTPRLGAGEPIVNDFWKCQLTPLTRQSFPSTVTFTPDQWAKLQSAFPSGVCDYTNPPVGRQRSVPWLTYKTADGAAITAGTPLGSPPSSIPFSR